MALVGAVGPFSALTAGCPTEPLQTVDAFGTGGTTGEANFVAPPEGEVSGGFRELAALTGPVALLDYTLDTEKRLYLIRGDLNARLDPIGGPIATLHFPRGPDALAARLVAVGADQNWGSLRVYDLGHCSVFFPWRQLQTTINTLALAALNSSGTFNPPNSIAALPAGIANVGPILVRSGTLPLQDELRYNFTFNSTNIGASNECGPFVCDVETRFGVRETPATLIDSCTATPRVLPTDLHDFALVPREARAEVRDYCTWEVGPYFIEDGISGAMATAIPSNFITFVDNLSRFPVNAVFPGASIPCSCDSDCAGFDSSLGPRSRCVAGGCEVRVELDRIFLMPEGFVIVYAEDANDPQVALLESAAFEQAFYDALNPPTMGAPPSLIRMGSGVDYSCGTNHFPVVTTSGPMGIVIPAVLDPSGL